MSSNRPLVVIPSYVRTDDDVSTTVDAIRSVADHDDMADTYVVDDGSPYEKGLDDLIEACQNIGAMIYTKAENEGFSKTVNVGLRKALQEGRDAILMNADVEIHTPDFVREFVKTTDEDGDPAAVAGALLMYPNGLIQHGGIYFSLLTRSFDHSFKFAPMNLKNAHVKKNCPVTGALQYIRHETMTRVGIYDESFFMGWEDVDYCLRVFDDGMKCVFNPDVRAWHAEMMFRGRPSPKVQEWQQKSYMVLASKWAHANFAEMVPFI